MSGDNLIPISDEQAKLAQELLRTGRDAGGYLADILDDLPKDLVGILAGDYVKAKRAERLAILWAKTKKRLQDRGVIQPEPPSLKLALPILEAAADENRQELQDLWERLLTASMDPNRRDLVRQSLIPTVKQMDPMDVIILEEVGKNQTANWTPNGRDFMVARLKVSHDEVLVSFGNLERLACIGFMNQNYAPGSAGFLAAKINPMMAPLGTLLMKAVRN